MEEIEQENAILEKDLEVEEEAKKDTQERLDLEARISEKASLIEELDSKLEIHKLNDPKIYKENLRIVGNMKAECDKYTGILP